jgi:hypothetical protein
MKGRIPQEKFGVLLEVRQAYEEEYSKELNWELCEVI